MSHSTIEGKFTQDWISIPICLFLAISTLALDYLTGPFIHFPILYLLPVLLTSWRFGFLPGVVLACSMPLIRFSFDLFWVVPWGLREAAFNTAVQILIFSLFSYLTHVISLQNRELMREVKVLEGLLPICSFCKKIRNQDGDWEVLESYISEKTDAEFSHGLCPACAKKHYGDFLRDE